MSWFEQGASNARCIIIQLHRPAELKLRRMCRRVFTPVCSPDMREFFLLWKEAFSWNPGKDESKPQHGTCRQAGDRCALRL